MSMMLPRIAARVFNTPLMVDSRKAAAMLAALGGRLDSEGVTLDGAADQIHHVAFEHGRPSAGQLGDRLGRRLDLRSVEFLDVVGNVAVIPVEGTLVHKGAWVDSYSGETSYQGLQTQIRRAAARPDVKGVAFEVDSFGGEVSGAFETADMIADLSQAKPTIAILTDYALSAGYLLAAAAGQVVMPAHGGAGSIGVIALHADYSAQLAQKGIKVTILHAGARKADGNPFSALPDEVAARWQASLESARRSFAEAVGRYRGARFAADRALATEAQDYAGADALALGLVDALGPGNQAFEAFVREVNRF
jgi:signal peptide peptidase SppA